MIQIVQDVESYKQEREAVLNKLEQVGVALETVISDGVVGKTKVKYDPEGISLST